MKIAITGGNGRVGQVVVAAAIEQGHTVVSIDRTNVDAQIKRSDVEYHQVDLTNYDAFEDALSGCEGLIHLAAIPSPGQLPDHVVHNNNVVSSYNALTTAVQLGIDRVCQASSINAIGAAYSRDPHFDYLPVDEAHPTYNEDPYSLSKWICEQQADSIARRNENMSIASLRIHWVVDEKRVVDKVIRTDIENKAWARNLWGYVHASAVARACLLSLTADFKGHEVFFIVAPNSFVDLPSIELKEKHFPNAEWRGAPSGNQGFFNCTKAERLLGWQHDH